MGLSAVASVKVKKSKLEAAGPLLITHWGMSGPGILRLSAWGARELAEKKYQFAIQVNWLHESTFENALDSLKEIKENHAKKLVSKYAHFELPKRLWENLVKAAGISEDTKWADMSKKQLNALGEQLTNGEFHVNGKSTFKEEFVTAGGIDLKEVNFKTMESKILPNVYFAGEILNIDAITGGFNFQNAWTGGFIVAENISK
jgi:predicted Rossmann fold flavoprotein